ncbi:MAG: AAA family ATPase, partial [Bryobacterales bacterium]|nr:AAA family ATPase [Bryobacterales bacterium]
MLLELVVENFAVVEKLRLRFHEGLNVLTGETGSGKSLVVDALGLLLGGRGSTDLIRTGAPRAFVGGIFELPSGTHFSGWLEENSITAEDGELLIEREILANGKSRAFAGGRPVTAAFLRGLAPHLGDIHGQHDQQQLFDPGSQLGILDESGSIAREEVRSRFRAWRDAVARLNELDRNEKDKLRLADLWNMQRNEIEGASPAPGEDASLENERRVLKNVAKLQENASAAFEALSDAPESAAANLRAALKRIEELARIDANLKALLETLRPAQIAIDDVSHELRHYLGSLEADPGRLEHVESRLALIDRLKKKYGATIEEVLEFLAGVTRQLSALENSAQRRAELTLEAERLEQEFR